MNPPQQATREGEARYAASDRETVPERATASSSGQPRRGITSLVLAVLLVHRRVFAIGTGSIVAVAMAVLLVIPRRYTSTAAFVVEAAPTAGLSSAMAIISQLNPNLAGGDSPKFYVDLIQSRPVLEHILNLVPSTSCVKYTHKPVLDIIDPAGNDVNERLANGVDALRDRVSSGYDLRTGVIQVGIEAECPTLARELADSLVASVNTFNIDRRQTRAKLRRQFSEQQASQADSALHRAEDDLSAFQSANRVMETPRLALESDRLRRRVSEREEVAAALRRDASTARLEEINSIPALTVIEPPNIPIHASFPKRRVWGLLILVFALAIGSICAIVRFAYERAPAQSDTDLVAFHAKLAGVLKRGAHL